MATQQKHVQSQNYQVAHIEEVYTTLLCCSLGVGGSSKTNNKLVSDEQNMNESMATQQKHVQSQNCQVSELKKSSLRSKAVPFIFNAHIQAQPSNNFPWFFDQNPSFEHPTWRGDAFLKLFYVRNFCFLMYNVEYFSKKLKQANQATISHGSSI